MYIHSTAINWFTYKKVEKYKRFYSILKCKVIKKFIYKPSSDVFKVYMTKQKSALELFCLYKAVHARGHLQHACAALTFLAKLHQSSVSLCLIVHYGSPHRDKQSASYLRTEVTSPPLILSQGAHWHSQSLPAPPMGRLCGPLKTWHRKYSHAVWHSTGCLMHSLALIPVSFKGRQTRKTTKPFSIFPLRQRGA